ncbi:MAG: MFS transporter, partial [Clostridiales bacterium]|nr:MFS transporter [Clostridiales bacterium]
YSSRHMNWLHCCWGVGAAISPYIMSYCLIGGYGWNSGYRSVAIIQIILSAFLFISLPLWKKNGSGSKNGNGEENDTEIVGLRQALKIRGVKLVLITFFGYCALETTAGLWASSYLVLHRGVAKEIAAQFASLFFIGITFGRFLCGFISDKFGDKQMIRYGLTIITFGIVLIILPIGTNITALAGLIIVGLGCAPIYPAIIHSTPSNFGAENSQAIIGIQMASAYTGSTLMPPVFGVIADNINIGLYPFYLLFFAALMIIMSEKLNRTIAAAK